MRVALIGGRLEGRGLLPSRQRGLADSGLLASSRNIHPVSTFNTRFHF
jgi:hypothetical protein